MLPKLAVAVPDRKPLEDLLEHLPCSCIEAHPKGHVIFSPERPLDRLYLIIAGIVALSRISETEGQVLVDIYAPYEFFGESAVLGCSHPDTRAVALQDTQLMTWTSAQLQTLMAVRPKLGLALLQRLAVRQLSLMERLTSFSAEQIPRRMARTLIYFSGKLGRPECDGSVTVPGLTHALLAEYVGTSREIVTSYLNDFRRAGYMTYSRKSMIIFPSALKSWMQDKR